MGPLKGLSVIELTAPGPVEFAAMLLSDLGADVLTIDRPAAAATDSDERGWRASVLRRGRRSLVADLKQPRAVELVLRIAERSDVLLEGFRPGVAEKLGLGPQECRGRNDRLVYGRVTGWGRQGPLAQSPGFDINFTALSGALGSVGRAGEAPLPTPGLVGDFGGGGMLLALGVLGALFERANSNHGQVVDAAMIDGAALLTAHVYGALAAAEWNPERGTNMTDSGAPFCDTYATLDGEYVAIGALRPGFLKTLAELTDFDAELVALHRQPERWPELRQALQGLFASRSREEWCRLLEGTDACVTPVLSPLEAPTHPHHRERESHLTIAGVEQPAPAPRFDRSQPDRPLPPPRPGEGGVDALQDRGLTMAEIDDLIASGAIATSVI